MLAGSCFCCWTTPWRPSAWSIMLQRWSRDEQLRMYHMALPRCTRVSAALKAHFTPYNVCKAHCGIMAPKHHNMHIALQAPMRLAAAAAHSMTLVAAEAGCPRCQAVVAAAGPPHHLAVVAAGCPRSLGAVAAAAGRRPTALPCLAAADRLRSRARERVEASVAMLRRGDASPAAMLTTVCKHCTCACSHPRVPAPTDSPCGPPKPPPYGGGGPCGKPPGGPPKGGPPNGGPWGPGGKPPGGPPKGGP